MNAQSGLVVLFGGTGVIGQRLVNSAISRGTAVLSISLDPDVENENYTNKTLDLAAAQRGEISRLIDAHRLPSHKTITMVDLMGLGGHQFDEAAHYAANANAAFGIVSSSLLYRPRPDGVYHETSEIIQPDQALFPYQRLKLNQEAALKDRDDVQWRIFRTNHVIGRGGLLGCIPDHNRDARLLDDIMQGKPLRLARHGNVKLSFIHAHDLAEGVLRLCAKETTAQTAMNLIHPDTIIASDYFRLIAALLGARPPIIENFIPEANDFWSLTASDNVLVNSSPEISQLTFDFDLKRALADALEVDPAHYASLGQFLEKRIR